MGALLRSRGIMGGFRERDFAVDGQFGKENRCLWAILGGEGGSIASYRSPFSSSIRCIIMFPVASCASFTSVMIYVGQRVFQRC